MIVGAGIFFGGVSNHAYYVREMNLAKAEVPEGGLEPSEKTYELEKYINLKIDAYNKSRRCTRVLGFVGLGLFFAGYVGKGD
jgi:hypothetical protein